MGMGTSFHHMYQMALTSESTRTDKSFERLTYERIEAGEISTELVGTKMCTYHITTHALGI